MLIVVLLTSCFGNRRAPLEKAYSEARLEFSRGFDQQALQKAQEGFRKSNGFPDLEWMFRVLLAEIDLRQEQPRAALARLSAEPGATIPIHVHWRRTLSQGFALCKLQNFREADQRWMEAKQLAGTSDDLQNELKLFIGLCELTKGNRDNARLLLRSVESSATVDPFVRAYALRALGWCALLDRHFEEAIDWYSRARESSHVLGAAPFEERALGNLGYSYLELGNFDKAQENSQAAEKLAKELNQTRDREKWLLDLGRAYHNQGKSALAQEHYERSLAVARVLGDQAIAARCLHNLVQMELAHGKLASAEQYHNEASKLRLEGADQRDFRIDEAGIAAARGDWSQATVLYRELLPEAKEVPRLKWIVEAGLARAYAAQGRASRADQWFQQSIATMEAAASNMNGMQFKVAMLDNWPIFDDYIAFLEEQKQPERALQVAQMARARALAEQLGFKQQKEDAKAWVRRIQAMLRARNAVILAYYEAEHTTYLWLLTPKRLLPLNLRASQNELEALADSYTREVQEHSSLEESAAQQKLYQILLKPVRELLPKGTHVILVADSALYRINFETLISDEGALHYWIEDAELENACSIDLLLAGQHSRRNGKGLLLIGAPDQATPEFPSLPNAPQEMERVRKHFPSAEVKSFSGAAATPEAYTTSDPGQFKYIELATHGKPSASNPMDSSIILSRGANGKFELYAREIIADKLKLNADLVTFSACYGAGKVASSAEGLLGLQWAFMRAGAHQVVAGLWDVNDESVPQLMGGLYEGVVKGRKSAPASLRAAKLAMLHSGGAHSAPYYWAPLQVYTGP